MPGARPMFDSSATFSSGGTVTTLVGSPACMVTYAVSSFIRLPTGSC